LSDAIDYGGKICIQPTIIMMLIGVLIASWIASGTVPMIIYWGLKLISPSVFLLTACLISAIIAIAIGSSWSTAGTVGVALMGVGLGLGINPAMTAGAVISGAYLGDKMSPMSDTTNLAPAVAEADLFDHIRSMMVTTGPAFVISLIIYGLLGLKYSADSVDSAMVAATMDAIQSHFTMNILLLLPAVVVIVLAILKAPSIPTLLLSALTAVILAMIFQGQSLSSILNILDGGFSIESGLAEFDRLMNRGGLQSMLWTAALGILGMLYGAIMEKTGLLTAFMEKLKPLVKSTGGLITTVIVSCTILLAATASQTLAIVVGGRMYITEFKKKDLLPQTLSRTLEDSGTIISPLVPWSLCGAYMAGTLGVSTVSYLPFAFFCWLCPIIAIIYGFTGKFMWKTGDIASKKVYSSEPVPEAVPAE
ncbi:MAG: Na+/H+ antiporter NhaC, partial [Oscillospiraceae bacterium]|nr:Na+/H+ antiporter NhaC [Oscillospiraceae bacterium]